MALCKAAVLSLDNLTLALQEHAAPPPGGFRTTVSFMSDVGAVAIKCY